GFVLEAQHHVVRITDDDHVAFGLSASPLLGPQVDRVVQVDVREQRANHRPLPGSPFTCHDLPVFEDPRLQPFLYQADDACIGYPMLDEFDQPLMADRIEKASDIQVKNPVHFTLLDAYN